MSEVVQHMSADDARRLTERIRITAHNYAEARDKLVRLVQEAKDGNAHDALGYESWTAYLAETLGAEPMRLARDDRQDMVRVLSAEGMSTRAIASVVGVGIGTVSRDQRAPVPSGTPEPDAPHAPVTGLDGKTYTRPEPKEAPEPPRPKRTPLADTARDLGLDIAKIADRTERLMSDDRFTANKNEVAARLRHHLARAVEVLADLDNAINQ